MTPSVAEESTYQLFSENGQGTGWAIDGDHMVTAGHMCDAGKGTKLSARTNTGFQFSVEVVDFDMSYDGFHAPKDICLLKSDRKLGTHVILAGDMPVEGTEAWYVGYPRGEFVKSVGKYIGDADGVQTWNNYVVTAPCDHGASGSAYFTEAGVFGVLVRLLLVGDEVRDGSEGCVATPLGDIFDILHRNGIVTE
jgi:hypothetical protein